MSAVLKYLHALDRHRQQLVVDLEADLGDCEAWLDFRRQIGAGKFVGPPAQRTRNRADRCEDESRALLPEALAALNHLRGDLRADWRDRLEVLQHWHEGLLSALLAAAEEPGKLWADRCANHQERVEAVRREWLAQPPGLPWVPTPLIGTEQPPLRVVAPPLGHAQTDAATVPLLQSPPTPTQAGGEPANTTIGQTTRSPRRKKMTVAEANEEAMKVAGKMRVRFFAMSERQQAKMIGCSWKTWTKTPLFATAQDKRPGGRRKKTASPKIESLTATREAVTGEGDKDEVLQKLIDEQAADGEPSPLESRPRKIHCRKRL